MNKLTVTPLLVALVLGLAYQALPIFNFAQRGLGIHRVEPWRIKSLRGITRAVSSLLQAVKALFRNIRVGRLVAATAMALLAVQLGVAHVDASMLMASGALLGEISMVEVKKALDESNQLFHGQLTKLNTDIAELRAAGKVVDPLMLALQTKLNGAMDKASDMNEQFMAMQAKLNVIEKSGGNLPEREQIEARAAQFDRIVRAHSAAAGKPAQSVTVDSYKAYEQAFSRYLVVGEKGLSSEETRAMSVGSDLNGGFLVTPDKTGRMVEKIFETSDVRRFASVQAISTDALEGSADLDEATGGWVSELGTRSDSTSPQVPAPWRIPVHELYSQPKASQKLINDGNINVADWLVNKIAGKLSRLQNTAFVTGNGVGQPRGFASYTTSTTYAWGTPEHVGTGSSGSWGTDPTGIQKLNSLMGLLKDAYVPGSAFFMNRTTKFSIRNLTDASSAGKFVFIPSMTAGVPDTLLGAPVNVLQDMASYSTASALAVAYGNMAEYYQIVDRQNVSVLVDPFTAKPYVIYYTTARVGGDVVNFDAMKFIKFA